MLSCWRRHLAFLLSRKVLGFCGAQLDHDQSLQDGTPAAEIEVRWLLVRLTTIYLIKRMLKRGRKWGILTTKIVGRSGNFGGLVLLQGAGSLGPFSGLFTFDLVIYLNRLWPGFSHFPVSISKFCVMIISSQSQPQVLTVTNTSS
ncbi:Uncharacterized protein HZ326_27450 [Fusarium oxysporum f. sp. albedinis]|nr:Uncharacterized protein HZ326_27450 [Fusarium oxysporum f. sp. albedinis]